MHDDDTGVTGLIDWTGSTRGPVLYDVASTVMYLGGPERAAAFLAAYRGEGPHALWHFSEDPGIERFVPHVPATNASTSQRSKVPLLTV